MRRPKNTITAPTSDLAIFNSSLVTLIGYVTICWSALEFELQALIWELSESEEIGDILTRRLGVERWVDDIRLLAAHRISNKDAIKSLGFALDAVRDVQVRRNGIIHNLFAAMPQKGEIGQLVKSPRGKRETRSFTTHIETLTADELNSLINDICSARRKLISWQSAYVRAIGPRGRLLPPLRH